MERLEEDDARDDDYILTKYYIDPKTDRLAEERTIVKATDKGLEKENHRWGYVNSRRLLKRFV